ncbi:nucleotide kinase [Escherichia phage C5]|uniref:Nucleotide kinase n=1 Tax=Escherichia phage C5 TaxID=2340717 RepID=A0A386K7D8_9CAUD|nr:nucleotide kinase [Escherichia phage C5]AYD80179.1 nucleotide kinase [Escherichia phage C5]
MTTYDAMIIKLIDMNEGNPDHLSNCSFQCAGVPCSICPAKDDDDMTLGEIREMDPRKSKPEKPEVTPTDDQPSTESIEGVTKPSHYMLFDDIEAIEVIARSMTREQFKGYCFGNILKYRLRAGKKSELAYLEKDMAKAGFYGELYEKHKDKCYDS